MNTPRPISQRGFTLIELSIVLVIIGLIIGGVLVGRDLIDAAKVRKQVTELENVTSATAAFKLKYNCLPGDCASATSIFGTTGSNGLTILDGDGNSIIRSMLGDTSTCSSATLMSSEVSQYWEHLYVAGLWGFSPNPNPPNNTRLTPGVDYPFNSYNRTGLLVSCIAPSNIGNWSFNEGLMKMQNIIMLGGTQSDLLSYAVGVTSFVSPNGDNLSGVPFELVRAVDRKIDDGMPSTGAFGVISVLGGGSAWWNAGCGGAGIGYQGGTNTYDTFTAACPTTAGKFLGL